MSDIHARTRAVNDATYAAWNAHDPDAVAAVFAVDAVLREAGSPNVLHGRGAIRARAHPRSRPTPDRPANAPTGGGTDPSNHNHQQPTSQARQLTSLARSSVYEGQSHPKAIPPGALSAPSIQLWQLAPRRGLANPNRDASGQWGFEPRRRT